MADHEEPLELTQNQQDHVAQRTQSVATASAQATEDSRIQRRRRLKAAGGMISVLGALVLFFAWSVKSTLYQHYAQLKSSIQTAESTFRLYNTLHELRNSINSVAMEIVQEKTGIHATRFRSGKTGDPAIDGPRRKFDLTRLSAHQLKELMDFAAKTQDLSNSLSDDSETHEGIVSLTKTIKELRDAVSDKEAAAEAEINIPVNKLSDTSFPAVNEYARYWHKEAVFRIPQLFHQIVDASNSRVKEARDKLIAARRKADIGETVAFYLYFLGSLLALGGQAMDKLIRVEAPNKGINATTTAEAP